MADAHANKENITPDGQLYLDGFEQPKDNFLRACRILTELAPDFKDGDQDAFNVWVQHVRERMIADGIDMNELKKIIPNHTPNGLKLEDGDIFVYADGDPLQEDSKYIQLASIALLSYWLLSDASAASPLPESVTEQLPRIISRRLSKLEYPLDKPNAKIWNLLENDMSGQIAIAVEKKGSKKPLNIYYAIDFDELGSSVSITKKLEPYDKRVYIAIAALYNAGYEIMSITMIYNTMGYDGRPNSIDIEKINRSITKMGSAHIYLNSEEESAVYKNYPRFVYDASLLPFERIQAVFNGQKAETAIHPFREPPMISFARERKQITTVERKVLQAPISKTNQNLLIEDYLIERIAKAKKPNSQRKILYATIYKKVNITTAKQRQRAPEKIRKFLDHYKKCAFIRDYHEAKDGITIDL